MVTVKRLYLYSVLAVSLALLVAGITDVVRLVLDGVSGIFGTQTLVGSGFAREDFSRALALVIIGAPLWGFHAWLVRRAVSGPTDAADDERASAARATYFFVVLVVTLAVACSALIEAIATGVRLEPGDGFWGSGTLPVALVVGTTWVLHARWRGRDLRLAPAHTADDWLTRAYLYGVLFVSAILALYQVSDLITVLGRSALAVRPVFASGEWLRDAAAGPIAGSLVLGAVWVSHWFMAGRLMRADDPMGAAHRTSRTRVAYLLGTVAACAGITLVLLSSSLRDLLSDVVLARNSIAGRTRLIEDIGGPVLATIPFVMAWWWHVRRSSREALALIGPARQRAVVRTGRLIVAAVGLVGLSAGLAWGVSAAIDLIEVRLDSDLILGSILRGRGAEAFAAATIGLVMWLPAWILLQRERAVAAIEVARSTARRAYLVGVSGVAVIAAMIAGAWLIYQVTRILLDAGRPDDTSWAIGVLTAAGLGLAYHLFELRADARIVHRDTSAEDVLEPTPSPAGTSVESPPVPDSSALSMPTESIEIIGPPGADWDVVNASIRERLPAGYVLRVTATDGA